VQTRQQTFNGHASRGLGIRLPVETYEVLEQVAAQREAAGDKPRRPGRFGATTIARDVLEDWARQQRAGSVS
jgi:hypothetical protein